MEFRFALAGDPVAHSLSPAMHRAALEEAGLVGDYELVRCDPAEFRSLVDRLKDGEFSGLNVTMPHKRLAYTLCDRLSDEADVANSVNTMKVLDSLVWGHSSDVVAFRKSIVDVGDPKSLILIGTGGSARAALAAFHGPVYVWGRSAEKIESLKIQFPGRVFPFEDSPAGSVLVNCTPLGMNGELLPDILLEKAGGLIDLPYGDGETPAVSWATRNGLPFVDGYGFLAVQAAESFHWWTGFNVGPSTMAAAARNG
jgi:shikimate dehydrogenase